MQIDDGRILGWLWEGFVVLVGAVAALVLLILRGYRNRLIKVEEKMAIAVTMPQVEHVAETLQKEFKDDHSMIIHGQRAIMTTIDHNKEEMKDYIRDMFEAREARWNGRDRRKN